MITSIRTILGEKFINGVKKYIAGHVTDYHSSIYGSVTFESGTFVLSADGLDITGSDAGITLSNAGVPATLDTLVGGTGYTVGTKATTGGTGTGLTVTITEAGGIIQTAVIANAGTGYTTGDTVNIVGGNDDATINVATIEPVVITIPTAKRLKLANIHSVNNATSDDYSIGIDNGISVSYIANQSGIGVYSEIGVVSISVFDNSGTDYCTGLITDIRATEFDITLTQVGAGDR